MKTQKQKYYDKLSNRLLRLWRKFLDFVRTVIDALADADWGEVVFWFMMFIIFALVFVLFYHACNASHQKKQTPATCVVHESSLSTEWDIDTTIVIKPSSSELELHFKGTNPYYLTLIKKDSTK